jgi:TM2 domain-containing membrane protein YozV
MNCANHTERTATAFCQNCGKPLCPECTRSAAGLLLCEPCLLARYPNYVPGAATIPGSANVPFTPVPGAAAGYGPTTYGGHPSPFLAGLLGFIPGVGAMYNGQFIKGLLHVVIFIVLIGITSHLPLFGILIAAWEFYQVFDAAHTAAARRDGRPLPDPFGLLDLSQRMGPGAAYPPPGPVVPGSIPGTVPGTVPGGIPPVPPVGGFYPGGNVPRGTSYGAPYTAPAGVPGPGMGAVPGTAAYTPVSGAYAPVVPPDAYYPKRRGEPIGAIILIALGVLFLLNTLDVLDFDWISRGWPVFLLVLGIWLLIRRANRSGGGYGPQAPPPSAGYPPQTAPPAPPAPGTSLSIYPAGERAAGFEETAASFHSPSEEEK